MPFSSAGGFNSRGGFNSQGGFGSAIGFNQPPDEEDSPLMLDFSKAQNSQYFPLLF